jgi:hypothetical protein
MQELVPPAQPGTNLKARPCLPIFPQVQGEGLSSSPKDIAHAFRVQFLD